jgi:hypothetical protein
MRQTSCFGARRMSRRSPRAERLAPAIGADSSRLLDWCAAFAAMVALDIAEATDGISDQVESLIALASRGVATQTHLLLV